MSQLVTNLIPTSILYDMDEIFRGDLTVKNVKIVLGSGLEYNFNPVALSKEIKNIEVEIKSISFKREKFSFLCIVNLEPIHDQINEIGIFYLHNKGAGKDEASLIAYLSDKNLIKFSSDSRDVLLELVLPASPSNKQRDTSVVTNFSSDIYKKTPENIENISGFFSDESEQKSSAVKEGKLNFSWAEVIKTEILFPKKLSLIAFDCHPKKNILLFLYKDKKDKKFFFNTYDVVKQAFQKPSLSMTVIEEEETNDRYGIFGKVDDEYIRCYQSHEKGVFCICLGVTGDKKSYCTQEYHLSVVTDTATLFKLGNNAALGGGVLGRFKTGKCFEARGVSVVHPPVCLQPFQILDEGTDNPLIDYILPDDCDEEGEIEVIGGLKEWKPIEDKTIEEVITEEVITEEVITEEVITEEVITEEVITEEVITEEENEILYGQNQKKTLFVIIKDKKIEIKKLPIQTISVDRKVIKEGTFRGFNNLNSKYNPPEIYKFETIADFNAFSGVNALTHMLCRVKNRTYIFSRAIFKDEKASKFFVYDRVKREINTYIFPEEIRKLVINREMLKYTDTHVVASNKIIYFVLHLYSEDNHKLSTQIIKLEVTESDEKKSNQVQIDLQNKLDVCTGNIGKLQEEKGKLARENRILSRDNVILRNNDIRLLAENKSYLDSLMNAKVSTDKQKIDEIFAIHAKQANIIRDTYKDVEVFV